MMPAIQLSLEQISSIRPPESARHFHTISQAQTKYPHMIEEALKPVINLRKNDTASDNWSEVAAMHFNGIDVTLKSQRQDTDQLPTRNDTTTFRLVLGFPPHILADLGFSPDSSSIQIDVNTKHQQEADINERASYPPPLDVSIPLTASSGSFRSLNHTPSGLLSPRDGITSITTTPDVPIDSPILPFPRLSPALAEAKRRGRAKSKPPRPRSKKQNPKEDMKPFTLPLPSPLLEEDSLTPVIGFSLPVRLRTFKLKRNTEEKKEADCNMIVPESKEQKERKSRLPSPPLTHQPSSSARPFGSSLAPRPPTIPPSCLPMWMRVRSTHQDANNGLNNPTSLLFFPPAPNDSLGSPHEPSLAPNDTRPRQRTSRPSDLSRHVQFCPNSPIHYLYLTEFSPPNADRRDPSPRRTLPATTRRGGSPWDRPPRRAKRRKDIRGLVQKHLSRSNFGDIPVCSGDVDAW